ncbi:MAG: hypothetical protein U0L26_07560 [Cellulosilyticum sp.]|nr:hypothetical protein [Cellulosilyticum sp.]
MSIDKIVTGLEERLEYNGQLNQLGLVESTDIIVRVSSLVIGLLAVIIAILIPLIVTMEIVYICFPIIREKTEKLVFKVESKGHKLSMLGFTLRDAVKAVEQSEVHYVGEKSALWIYLKLKCKHIFLAMFLIGFVLSGHSIVLFIEGLISGLLNILYSVFYFS